MAGADETTNQLAAPYFRRAMIRIIPFVMLLYFINYLDRVNIGYAKLQFLGDLGLDDAQFGLATGLFFLTYSLLEVPSNLLAARIGVRPTLLRIMVAWGVLSAAQMAVSGPTSLYVLRLLFGAAEAGFFPCILLYLSRWFPNEYRGRVMSLLMMSIPISAIIGGPISGAIMQYMDGAAGLRGWQWLFLLEGGPAVALGIAAYLYLDETPAEAAWLGESGRRLVCDALESDAQAAGQGNKPSLRIALRDPLLYAIALLNFAVNAGTNAVSFWGPSIIRGAGIANAGTIGWVLSGVSALCALCMLAFGWSSDRHGEQRWHFTLGAMAAAAGFLLLPAAAGDLSATVAAVALAAVGNLCALAIYWTIPTSYLRGRGAAGGLAFVSTVGALGSAASPIIVGQLRVATGRLDAGLAVVAAMLVVSVAIVVLVLPKRRTAAMTVTA